MNKKLHIIVLAFNRVMPLRMLIDCFILQSYPYWNMTIVHDGAAPGGVKNIITGYTDPRISFIETEKINGHYGFPNRQMMVERSDPKQGEFLLFSADDSYYVPHFIEFMMDEAKDDVGMVYCDMVHSHIRYSLLPGELKVNHIDMGAFITDIQVAKEVGFQHINEFAADGMFAEECAAKCHEWGLRTVHVPKPLFIHN